MLTKQERQKIIDAHIRQYGDRFEARHFADTVQWAIWQLKALIDAETRKWT